MPVPGLPDVTLSQAASLVADHGQCAAAFTKKLPVVLSSVKDALLGEISSVQASRPSSRTVTDWPAMVSVPVRTASVVFGGTLTLTTPLPLPFAPLVIEIQPLSETAVQVQEPGAATFTAFDPPDAPNESDDVETV